MIIAGSTLIEPFISIGGRYGLGAIFWVNSKIFARPEVFKVVSILGILKTPLSTLREEKVSYSEAMFNLWKLTT